MKLYHPPGDLHKDPAVSPFPNEQRPPLGTDQSSPSKASFVSHSQAPEIPIEPDSEDEIDADDPVDPSNLERHLHLGTALATEDTEPAVDDGRDIGIPTRRTETYRDCELSPDLDNLKRENLIALLASYKFILTDIPGRTNTLEHHIELVTDTPIRHSYPLPHSLSAQLKGDLDKWIELGVVQSSNSPYCSPLLAVRKKDGSHRFCLDCRQINKITKFDAEPIADPQEIFYNLSSSKYLSKMDLSSGFWQLPLSEPSRKYTAFSTRFGHYEFLTMPFGLVNAPASFSRLMRIVTKDLTGVHAYMDDILIASNTWEEHLKSIEAILSRLRQHGLHAKPTKCMFGFQRLDYLGHLIGNGCYAPLDSKCDAIQRMPLPRTVTQLRSFLGSVGYYQKFISHYTNIAAQLFDLLKKGPYKELQWTEPAKSAFQQLKSALTQKPILQLPSPDLPFTLQTDASDIGLGAVLLQPSHSDPKKLVPVIYASRRLKAAELNYAVVEKEALAIYWAVRKFEVYLYGRVFELFTDHKPLLHLQSADRLNPRLKRWALYLNLFKFYSKHVKGSQNCLADLLSRSPLEPDL